MLWEYPKIWWAASWSNRDIHRSRRGVTVAVLDSVGEAISAVEVGIRLIVDGIVGWIARKCPPLFTAARSR